MMVRRRSRSFSRVRVAMMAGTVQPKPITIGIKLRPESPNSLKTRSTIKAARDM
jgi:hypothetical protein